MNDIELPPLPALKQGHWAENMMMHEQVQEYARIAVLAERERCAKVCEEARDRILGKQVGQVGDLGDAMLRQVAHMGAGACASAIRSPATTIIPP